ncbi:hypothetical protein FSS13T_24890 [Flavobacterium saliperosum S13]|uniref:Lipoprotein n=2 Tax=Flavobacterium saliperosum TaxID=329186 RepID=A0A1G4W6N8_9FLAO|nr:hypothetical protein [Flavobacterium saliperosum]ESU23038.1 hypothetical protein FSS13T_24890 [Flavobacterium saliperosum S13]SCX17596.1 hypothetical protein SAMN02927925_02537 [Flavobacterium saliperosum]
MKKIFLLFLVTTFAVSCSDENASSNENPTTFPMSASIDSQSFPMEPEAGGNFSDATGGIYGSEYHLLEGYRMQSIATAKTTLKDYKYYIRLAIPKIDVSVGTHTFTNTHIPNGYFADLDIAAVVDDNGENEATFNGKIIVNSYDVATQRVKGTFEFKTNNGVTATQTHVVSGTFNYVLAD